MDLNNAMSLLSNLLEGYFNQDWQSEFENADAVVTEFLQEPWSGHELKLLASELEGIARLPGDDRAVEELLFRNYRCYYMASADGITARQWLLNTAKRLEEECRP